MNIATPFISSKEKGRVTDFVLNDPTPENLSVGFNFEGIGEVNLKVLAPTEDDFNVAAAFYKSLSPESRMFFGPPNKFLNPNPNDIKFMLGKYPNYAIMEGEEAIGKFYLMGFGKSIEEAPEFENPAGLGMGIADRYQGMGLASLAMDVLEAVARSRGQDAIWLENFIPNEKAATLYQHKGYNIVGKEYFRRNLGFHDAVTKHLEGRNVQSHLSGHATELAMQSNQFLELVTDNNARVIVKAELTGEMKAVKRIKPLK